MLRSNISAVDAEVNKFLSIGAMKAIPFSKETSTEDCSWSREGRELSALHSTSAGSTSCSELLFLNGEHFHDYFAECEIGVK